MTSEYGARSSARPSSSSERRDRSGEREPERRREQRVDHGVLAVRLLVALDLPHVAVVFAPARDPPQVELAWSDPA